MTYTNFKKKLSQNQISGFLLSKLNIIKEEIQFFEIDIYPDFDKAEYEKGIDKTYYFENSWDFKTEYDSIINAKILDSSAFDFETISGMEKKYKVAGNKSRTDIIKSSYLSDKNSYSYYGLDNWDSFKINPVSVLKIDNVEKKLKYNGSFFGEVGYTEIADFKVYAKIKVEGFKYNFEFYKELIAESKALLSEKKYNLSYFITYSALENYINTELWSNDDEIRLVDKLKTLCKNNLGNLNENKIYSSIVTNFKHYTTDRNTIAHGKETISISEERVVEFLNFTLLIIYINQNKISSFEELYAEYTNGNNV